MSCSLSLYLYIYIINFFDCWELCKMDVLMSFLMTLEACLYLVVVHAAPMVINFVVSQFSTSIHIKIVLHIVCSGYGTLDSDAKQFLSQTVYELMRIYKLAVNFALSTNRLQVF